MSEYIIMLITSTICCFFATKCKKNKMLRGLLIAFTILIPSIVAGLRALNIGTDINTYGNYMHYVASNLSISKFFSIFGYSDILFSVFTLIIGIIFKNIHIYLFLLQLLNCILIYKACDNYKEHIPIWLSYLLFLLTLYFRQLNLLRQGIAISFSILAISYILRDNKKKFLINAILASLTHISAISVFLIYYIKACIIKNKDKKVSMVCIYSFLIILFLLFMPILKFITSSGILPSKYSFEYFSTYLNINHELDNLGTFFKLFWCILTLLIGFNKNLKEKIVDFDFFFHIVFIDFILWNLNIYIHYIDRLSFYFGFTYLLFYIPQISKIFKKEIYNKILIYTVILIVFLFYWYVRFIFQNAGNVFPYLHY